MRTWLMTGAALAAMTVANPALAQDTVTAATPPEAATQDATIDEAPGEIIVTAQKREERLQDVPLAVTVIGGEALAAQGRVSLEGAQYLVPSLTILKTGTTLNQTLFLRGVGTSTFSIAGEPSISTVVDGVVYSRAGEAFSDLVDIERMEVLRGPQGTLFGKNASAGVINIISKRPAKDFGGYVEGGFFSKDEYRVRGALNLPLTDNFLTRFTGYYNEWDGNIFNEAPNVSRKVNGFKHYGGRVQGEWTSGIATVNLIADYHKNKDDCCAEVIGTGPLTGAGLPGTSLAFAVLPTPRGDESRRISQDLVTRTIETGYGLSAQVDLDLEGVTVTSISAYRNYKNSEIRDGDWLPAAYIGFNQLHDVGPQVGNTISQEFRLSSQGSNFIDYTAGVYYSRAESERIFSRFDIVCTSRVTPAPTSLTPCSNQTLANTPTMPTGTADFGSVFKNIAGFGQATVNVAERFRLIGGLRFTSDQLDVFHSRNTTLAGPGIQPSFPVTPTGTGQPATVFRGKATNTNVSGKAGAQFDLSDASVLYGTYSRGYKGPAFNVFFNLTATGTNEISPETSDAYEVGLKNSFFGGQLVLNLAGYYAKYKNFQANNPDLVAGVVVTRFTNAGTVSTRGGELDFLWRPVRDLNLSGGVAYTDAKVDSFRVPAGAAPTAVVPAGTRLGFAPELKGSLAVDYRWRTGGAVDVFLGAQGSYQSKQLTQFSPDAVIRRLATQDGYGLVNVSAGITDNEDRFKLTFQVRNLFDQSFAALITNGGPSGSYRYQIPRDADRYYGVTRAGELLRGRGAAWKPRLFLRPTSFTLRSCRAKSRNMR